MKLLLLLHFAALLILAPVTGGAQESPRGSTAGRSEAHRFNPGGWLVSLFKDHLSAVDGDRCPSYPTCSSYSLDAIRKHGFVKGWMMTVDRLIHEGREEASISPMVLLDGKYKIYDPVENNDFWWHRKEEKVVEPLNLIGPSGP
jgi:hypothetical protein